MIRDWMDRIRNIVDTRGYEEDAAASTEQMYTDEAERALEEWKAAENYFNSITDPDLVEYALYEVEAARRKYEYLLRKLRSGDAVWEQA